MRPQNIPFIVYTKFKLGDWFLIFSLALFPYAIRISVFFMILHFLFSIKQNYIGFKFKNIFADKILLFSILFYMLHLLSLLYSQNLQHGLKDIETKFGLFFFPFLTLLFPRNENQKAIFVSTFILSTAFASIVCLVNSILNYVTEHDSSVFFYDRFSFLMHPTYFTMALSVALLFFLVEYNSEQNYLERKISSFWFNFLNVILIIAIFLTSSRAGIIINILGLFIFYTGKFCFSSVFPRKQVFFMLALSLLMFGILFTGSNRMGILINELGGKTVKVENVDAAKVDENPAAHRFMLMKVAFDVALANPFGVGVGDVQDILVTKYQEIGYEKAAEVRYNPHNQFLQSAVALGIPGVVVLCILFGLMLASFNMGKYGKLLLFVGVIFAFNGLFESVFEVQRGVLLFSFLLAFIGTDVYKKV